MLDDGHWKAVAVRGRIGHGGSAYLGPIKATQPYEVQQTSDTTYRVYDWDRPASAGRDLHLAQSAEVTTTQSAELSCGQVLAPGEYRERLRCESFVLDEIRGSTQPARFDTRGESFHALTVTRGQGQLQAGGETLNLNERDTVLLPASTGAYSLEGRWLEALITRLP